MSTFTGSVTAAKHPAQAGHTVAVRGHGPVALPGPFPADVGLADQLDLVRIDAEEAGGETPCCLVIVLLLLRWIGEGGRCTDAHNLIRRFPRQRPNAANQAANLCSRRSGVSVGFVEHQVLERGLGKQGQIRQSCGQDFQLPVVGQQNPRLPGPYVILRATLLGRCQWAHGPIFGLRLFPALLPGGQIRLPRRPGKAFHGHVALFVGRRAYP